TLDVVDGSAGEGALAARRGEIEPAFFASLLAEILLATTWAIRDGSSGFRLGRLRRRLVKQPFLPTVVAGICRRTGLTPPQRLKLLSNNCIGRPALRASRIHRSAGLGWFPRFSGLRAGGASSRTGRFQLRPKRSGRGSFLSWGCAQ